jgi:NhaP-type Na+/H+ or K+/H+ antiporter
MSYKILATVTTILAGVTAALAYLPYGWSHVVAGSLAAGLAAVSPVTVLAVKAQIKTTGSSAAGNTKLRKKFLRKS